MVRQLKKVKPKNGRRDIGNNLTHLKKHTLQTFFEYNTYCNKPSKNILLVISKVKNFISQNIDSLYIYKRENESPWYRIKKDK